MHWRVKYKKIKVYIEIQLKIYENSNEKAFPEFYQIKEITKE